ncbi:aquaporin NIP6-1-like [Abrus precatorius]|uniref:Aquaporin NIP6-1-like n=1 Tax=Abrus precatorius TaxID=3816 RepID=A0A8B8KPF2_ABRPR|nr:aquaporin NIP6-1-like [Abrus precatorius]XP_027344595.1 aquaporin NIP6-1-like [Abrus precatorius]
MENGEIPSVPSTPATPGTPGAPLFGGFKSERTGNGIANKSSLLKNMKCFSVEEWTLEDGALPRVSCSMPPPPVPLAKKVGAEFIGTFILMFAAIGTAIVNQKTHGSETLIGCAAANGLAVMIIIFSTGHICGAHLNPAVTISFAALKHFPWKNVPVYIGTQILASVSAAFALKVIFHPFMSGGVTVPSVGYGQAFVIEFTVSFILMFVVTAVATDTRAVGELAGIAVGATVMLNILIAGQATGSSMNPVRTLGPAIATNNYKGIWVYLTAPILGTLCGAGAYTIVKLPHHDLIAQPKAPSAPGSFRR